MVKVLNSSNRGFDRELDKLLYARKSKVQSSSISVTNIIKDVKNRPVIIAVTANADVADQKRCMDAGMNDFIAKPFNAKMLKEGLVKWQGLRRYLDNDDSDDVLRLIS